MLDWLPYPLFLGLIILGILWPAGYFLRKRKPTDSVWIGVVAAVTAINSIGLLAGEVTRWIVA